MDYEPNTTENGSDHIYNDELFESLSEASEAIEAYRDEEEDDEDEDRDGDSTSHYSVGGI